MAAGANRRRRPAATDNPLLPDAVRPDRQMSQPPAAVPSSTRDGEGESIRNNAAATHQRDPLHPFDDAVCRN